jgi:hypothetical protein
MVAEPDLIVGRARRNAWAYFFWRGFRVLQRKRLVMDTPRSTIRAAALGSVEAAERSALTPWLHP